jgi:hypothetical protein
MFNRAAAAYHGVGLQGCGFAVIQWRTLLAMQTVVELPEFIRRAQQLLSEGEAQLLVSYLAEFPQAGALIEGTGGIRKIRWAREGMGKRGGIRVIYYFHSERMPLYLLTVFGKNERADLSMAERVALGKFVKRLVDASR